MRRGDRTQRRVSGGRLRPLLLVLLVGIAGVSLNACASGGGPSATYDRNLIGEEELANLEERTTLLHAVQRLRPVWLQGRGQTRIQGSDTEVVVYINNQRAGGPSVLARWTNNETREMHFLDAITATQRFGTGHGSGAIIVVLR